MKKNPNHPNFSFWVNASAGTGKTKILIDRILRLLLENRKNILCLTFTNAAADEMENRIYNVLSRWSICSDSELVASIKQLGFNNKSILTIANQARHLSLEELTIQTIHAFCHKIISSVPMEAGISPYFTLSECKEQHSSAFDSVLQCQILQDNINAIATEISENELRDLLYLLYTKRPVLDLEYIKSKLDAPDHLHYISDEILKHIERLADILSKGSIRDQNHSKLLCEWSNNNIEDIAQIFIKLPSYEKKSKSSIFTKGIIEKFPCLIKTVDNIQDALLTYISNLHAHKIFIRTSNLLSVFKEYTNFYNSAKLKDSLLDYHDIIDLVIKLLSDKDWILFNLDQKIDHILVDEAQDNSVEQWKIIKILSDEFFVGNDEKRTLFVVGDAKQSIYRFQGASPVLFSYMQEYFCGRLLPCKLEKSFRSTPEILMFVDRLFNNFREEISFANHEIEHIPHRKDDQGYIEIWPAIQRDRKSNALQEYFIKEDDYVVDRLLAQTIAHKISYWLNYGRILVAKDRHIEPRDIIILVRQKNLLVDHIISALKKANVEVIGRDSFKIKDHIVVQDLIALGEFLLLPANDLALAVTLKSPLFNFTEDDLFNIAYDRKELSLWKRVQGYSETTYNELNELINLSRKEPPIALFSYVLDKGKKKFAERLGVECCAVIDEFMTLLLQFCFSSLQIFIQWIKENNPEVKINYQSDSNAVRIMTVHKSKGLQAPIVFLADTNTIPRGDGNIIFDSMHVPFWCKADSNIYCNQIKKEKKVEDYDEYLRLLYVAITRAEDELYILGKEPIQKNSWYDLITTYGNSYTRKEQNLHPMFKESVEVLCINEKYPDIYKNRSKS